MAMNFNINSITNIFIKMTGAYMLVCALQAYAAPVINNVQGNVKEQNSVTISGTGFGKKPTATAQPWLWDTFESGSNGGYVGTNNATIGQWQTGDGSNMVRYSNAHPHSGNMSSWHPFSTSIYNVSLSKNATFSKFYMEYWFYVEQIDGISRNFKPWRLYGNNDTMTYRYGVGCNYQNFSINDSTCTLPIIEYWSGQPANDRTWYHYQVYFQESNPATSANGRAIQYTNGIKDWDINAQTRCADNHHLDQLRIGHYWATDAVGSCAGNSGANIYIDNVYIDNGTWAHVELGNNANYDSCTKREVQIPTAWSDNTITVSINQSSFNDGETAYLYIVDDAGVMNTSGYAVKIGSDPSNSLSPPSSLHLVQ